MPFQTPQKMISFTINQICNLNSLYGKGAFADIDSDLANQILTEAAKFADEIIAPTSRISDLKGAKLVEGFGVQACEDLREPYAKLVEGGWQGISFNPEFGGMGLPKTLGLGAFEGIHSANLGFGLCPILTAGSMEALEEYGTEEQKAEFLPNLASGFWSGTMNLTEPQAGSDVGALTTRAEDLGDGTYKIYGQKIFITWGDHDFAENIIHLVLARLNGSPEGVKGISLFIVPKFLPDENGNYNIRNDVGPIGLEHKLGIHSSPTCVMAFGEGLFGSEKGAKGYLLGQVNKGMAAMFTMMNAARLNVGLQGVSVAEAATQKAIEFAKERIQGRAVNSATPSPIIMHPDVQRMLLTMQAKTIASRAICYLTSAAADFATCAETSQEAQKYKTRASFLTPIAKSWSSDAGVETTSTGVQVHGGMGFIEETGAAQYYRDSRITPIYEGTNAIQALDLIGRKLSVDNGKGFNEFVSYMNETLAPYRAILPIELLKIYDEALGDMNECAKALIEMQNNDRERAFLAANWFLTLCGNTIGGYVMLLGLGKLNDASIRAEYGEKFAKEFAIAAKFFVKTVTSENPAFKRKILDTEYEYCEFE